VNPETFLPVLQKTQLNKTHKQAIMQVAALPGPSPAPVGWVVSPVLAADGREGLRHPFLIASGQPGLPSTEGAVL
jgi:hypothetical protein